MANDSVSTLVDSNIILDVVTDDPEWSGWSIARLTQAADDGAVVINPIIYAEVSARFDRIEEVDAALPETAFRRDQLPYAAGFLAAKAFLGYRRRGGVRTTPLPDFYIGAHAAVAGHRLLTRDAARYGTYFPRVDLIAPTADN